VQHLLYNSTATSSIYTLSLHDALPISFVDRVARCRIAAHHTHVGKRSAHLKYQERTVAICVSHRPGLFTERYFKWALRFPTCVRSEEHTSELQSRSDLVCRLLLEKKK